MSDEEDKGGEKSGPAGKEPVILAWAKVILPLAVSWPVFGILFLVYFNSPMIRLIERFTQSDGGKVEIGMIKVELGVLPPQYRDVAGTNIKLKIDLSDKIRAIKDQGPTGATVGYSTGYALEIELALKHIPHQEIASHGIYEVAKDNDEWDGRDYEGSSVQGAMKGLREEGFYWLTDWPTDQKERPVSKSPAMKISTFSQMADVSALIPALKANSAVAVSMSITSDFDAPKAGIVKLSASPETLGGHSVCVVGYDEETKLFKFANSWGPDWGDNGYGYISENDLKAIWGDGYTLSVAS